MIFTIEKSLEILERTPGTLITLLEGLSPEWTATNEGPDTWSVYDVIGHLIHGEKTDWMARAKIILGEGPGKDFKPFDRFAQFEESKGKTLTQLLNEFKEARKQSVSQLKAMNLQATDLEKKGVHPKFGEVTLSQLLSTWVVHDLDHIYQISRVMAKQYAEAVGPWIEYLKILRQ